MSSSQRDGDVEEAQPKRRRILRIEPWLLGKLGLPLLIPSLIMFLGGTSGLCQEPDLDCLELFAGHAMVTRVFREHGYAACAFDCAMDEFGRQEHDLLSTRGFVLAVQLARRLKKGAVLLAGPPCSTWTFMNRGTAQRSQACPDGADHILQVQEGNVIVSRVVIIVLVALAAGAIRSSICTCADHTPCCRL